MCQTNGLEAGETENKTQSPYSHGMCDLAGKTDKKQIKKCGQSFQIVLHAMKNKLGDTMDNDWRWGRQGKPL